MIRHAIAIASFATLVSPAFAAEAEKPTPVSPDSVVRWEDGVAHTYTAGNLTVSLKPKVSKGHPADAVLSSIDCFRCGICCERYQPKVSGREIRAIAEHLGIAQGDFVSRFVQRVPLKDGFLLRRSEKGCVFLSPGGRSKRTRCTIHNVKPKACRDWVASLSRPECREGLKRLKPSERLLALNEIYSSPKAIGKMDSAVSADKK